MFRLIRITTLPLPLPLPGLHILPEGFLNEIIRIPILIDGQVFDLAHQGGV